MFTTERKNEIVRKKGVKVLFCIKYATWAEAYQRGAMGAKPPPPGSLKSINFLGFSGPN